MEGCLHPGPTRRRGFRTDCDRMVPVNSVGASTVRGLDSVAGRPGSRSASGLCVGEPHTGVHDDFCTMRSEPGARSPRSHMTRQAGQSEAVALPRSVKCRPSRRFLARHRPLCRDSAPCFRSYGQLAIGSTMSRAGLCPVAPRSALRSMRAGRNSGHSPRCHRPLRKARSLSSGR